MEIMNETKIKTYLITNSRYVVTPFFFLVSKACKLTYRPCEHLVFMFCYDIGVISDSKIALF